MKKTLESFRDKRKALSNTSVGYICQWLYIFKIAKETELKKREINVTQRKNKKHLCRKYNKIVFRRKTILGNCQVVIGCVVGWLRNFSLRNITFSSFLLYSQSTFASTNL